jgi:XapX domain-containing protein
LPCSEAATALAVFPSSLTLVEVAMKLYALSLGAGLLVGLVYSLLHVRSPAPPLVALVGLLGILVGEQIIPVGKQLLSGSAFSTACDKTGAVSHVLGQLPGRHQLAQQQAPEDKQS